MLCPSRIGLSDVPNVANPAYSLSHVGVRSMKAPPPTATSGDRAPGKSAATSSETPSITATARKPESAARQRPTECRSSYVPAAAAWVTTPG